MELATKLEYIGCKRNLLEWITGVILSETKWPNLAGKKIADLFAGTGIVSLHLRVANAIPIANDAELYSSVSTRAMVEGVYNETIQTHIATLNALPPCVGAITTHYSPFNDCERKFWTVENAQQIDAARAWLAEHRAELGERDYCFLLASVLVSADRVSNVASVYGAFLKNFKAKSLKVFVVSPIHRINQTPSDDSQVFHSSVERLEIPLGIDAIYLDPPYNQRQYSKNYFPLNVIANTECNIVEVAGVTGIPADCFVSDFCSKRKVRQAFESMFAKFKAEWVFMSYSDEGLLNEAELTEIMQKHGTVSKHTREYKRFKSNMGDSQAATVTEILFAIHYN